MGKLNAEQMNYGQRTNAEGSRRPNLNRAAERMLNEGKSREHVNEYLIKTPLEQIKTDNLEADRNGI
jgi:hypothetical protein